MNELAVKVWEGNIHGTSYRLVSHMTGGLILERQTKDAMGSWKWDTYLRERQSVIYAVLLSIIQDMANACKKETV